MRAQQLAGRFSEDSAATEGEYPCPLLRKLRGNDLRLDTAELGLAVRGEEVGNRPVLANEHHVAVDKRDAELLGDPAAEARLSRSHRADKHDGARWQAVSATSTAPPPFRGRAILRWRGTDRGGNNRR